MKGRQFFLELLAAPGVARQQPHPVEIVFTDGDLPPLLPPPSHSPRLLGGQGHDEVAEIVRAPGDGAYLVGMTHSFGAAPINNAWITRVDALGAVVWSRRLGGAQDHLPYGAAAAPDGGVLVVGNASQLMYNAWAARFGPDGELLWHRTYGSDRDPEWFNRAIAADGGFLLGGVASDGFGEQANQNCHGYAAWFVKVDLDGRVEWQARTAPIGAIPEVLALADRPQGGLRAVLGDRDTETTWVLDLDAAHRLAGQVALSNVWGRDADIAPDGSVAVAGQVYNAQSRYEARIAWVDSDLTPRWKRRVSLDEGLLARAAVFSPTGELVVAGYHSRNAFGLDAWVARFDAAGNALDAWEDGGAVHEEGFALLPTVDGGLWIAGRGNGVAGSSNIWLLRTDAAAAPAECAGGSAGPLAGVEVLAAAGVQSPLTDCNAHGLDGPVGVEIAVAEPVSNEAVCGP